MKLHPQKVPKEFKLYSYFRSSAAYRVRIALNLKGIRYDSLFVNLREGEQQTSEYKKINPQGLVPVLSWENHNLSQSLAIIDYIENLYPEPALYPKDALARAQVLELAYMVAMDIHPLNNLRVLNYLTNEFKIDENGRFQWYQHWLHEGFRAIETRLKDWGQGQFCYGDEATIADICLIPQVYNALRYECDMKEYVTIMSVYQRCLEIPEFSRASPDYQGDALNSITN